MLDKHAQHSSGKVSYTANGPIRMASDTPNTRPTIGAVLGVILVVIACIACYYFIGF